MSTAVHRKTMGGHKKFFHGGVRLAAVGQIGFGQYWRNVPCFSPVGILSFFLLAFGRNQNSSHRMNFKRILPHPALRKYIRGYWRIESGQVAGHLSLVLDGYPELPGAGRPHGPTDRAVHGAKGPLIAGAVREYVPLAAAFVVPQPALAAQRPIPRTGGPPPMTPMSASLPAVCTPLARCRRPLACWMPFC